MKVVAICRVSTDRQEIEAQKNELLSFILNDGVKEEDIIWVTGEGVSAIKEDDRFRANIQTVKEHIASGTISCCYAWELSRIARRKVTMDLLLEDLIRHKVQLKIKANSLILLNDDGSVNDGMELAITLFTSLAESEMRTKIDRFKRTKKANAEKGKWNGGNTRKFGYDIDENKYFIINTEEAELIQDLYEMYATGMWSTVQLSREMQQRGYSYITKGWLQQKLKDFAYTGESYETRNRHYSRHYPQIISVELYNKVQKQLKINYGDKRRNVFHYFANRLIQCNECSRKFTSVHSIYKCSQHHKVQKCISIPCMDGLLWMICKQLEKDYQREHLESSKDRIRKEIEIRRQKIQSSAKYLQKIEQKRKNIKDAFLDAEIDRDERDERMEKARKEQREIESQVKVWEEEIKHFERMVDSEQNTKTKEVLKKINEISASNELEMQRIVRKWVLSIDFVDDIVSVHTVAGDFITRYTHSKKIQLFSTLEGGYLPVYPILRRDDKLYFLKPKADGNHIEKAMYNHEQKLGAERNSHFVKWYELAVGDTALTSPKQQSKVSEVDFDQIKR